MKAMSSAINMDDFEGFRNRVWRVEKHARCAFMACESPQVDEFIRDGIGAVIDQVVADLMDIVDDMDKAIGKPADADT